jgi:hypothetical protein
MVATAASTFLPTETATGAVWPAAARGGCQLVASDQQIRQLAGKVGDGGAERGMRVLPAGNQLGVVGKPRSI